MLSPLNKERELIESIESSFEGCLSLSYGVSKHCILTEGELMLSFYVLFRYASLVLLLPTE